MAPHNKYASTFGPSNPHVPGGFVIGMASPSSVKSVLESGHDPESSGPLLNSAESQIHGPREVPPIQRIKSDHSHVPSVGFRLSPQGLANVFSDAKDVSQDGQFDMTAELDKEMSDMEALIENGDPQKHLRSLPGGEELATFVEENMGDITRQVTFMTTMPNGGFDDDWVSRILVYLKSDDGEEFEVDGKKQRKQWVFNNAVLMEPKMQATPTEDLELGMKLFVTKELNGPEVWAGAVAVWVTPVESQGCFYFWLRHELGASVCGIMKARDAHGHFLLNGERGCQLMSNQIAIKKQAQSHLKWGSMAAGFLALAGRSRTEEVKKALQDIGVDKDLQPAELEGLLAAMMPTSELGRLLSSTANIIGNRLVNDLEDQNKIYIDAIDGLAEAFSENLEDEKKEHDAARDREKKRFLKDLQSREKFTKGVSERANRLEAEVRNLRSQLEKAGKAEKAGPAAVVPETAGESTRLMRALGEVFA